jgi:hypothetical protein
MTTNQIYEIRTEADEEGNRLQTIGYATGNPKDIEDFFNDKKWYQLRIEPIQVVNITPELVKKKDAIKKEKANLEKRLGEINDFLG